MLCLNRGGRMKIAFGCDHAGFDMKEFLRDELKSEGFSVEDFGTHYPTPADYPDYAEKVALSVAAGNADFGVLICGTGLGMSISANKIDGIRAALCLTPEYAKLARQHNNANVLCLGGRFLERKQAYKILKTFLETAFDGDISKGARHKRRVDKIMALEKL